MLRVLKVPLVFTLLFLMQGSTMATYAQDNGQKQVTTLAAAENILYLFTGVTNITTPVESATATSVHCTNQDTEMVSLEVHFFPREGGAGYIKSINLEPGVTQTVSTRNTFYEEIIPTNIPVEDIKQGSGLVRIANSISTKNVICTAQILSAVSETEAPSFIVKLPLFDRYGNLVNPSPTDAGPSDIYLPVIYKRKSHA